MRSRYLAILALVVILALGGLYLALKNIVFVPNLPIPAADSTASPPESVTAQDTVSATAQDPAVRLAEIIVVQTPTPGSVVTSPITVQGRARGPWYFEAQFPVLLEDQSGAVVAAGSAHSQTEWMTPDFVPFAATLEFVAPPTTDTGTIVLQKSNPSAAPERADSLTIPVRFR